MSFTEGLNRIETPRNVVFEKQPDRGVRIVKYVGDRDAGTLNVLYEYTYSDEEWREIVKAMAKSYTEPPPEPEPEPEPEPVNTAPRAPRPDPVEVPYVDPAPRAKPQHGDLSKDS